MSKKDDIKTKYLLLTLGAFACCLFILFVGWIAGAIVAFIAYATIKDEFEEAAKLAKIQLICHCLSFLPFVAWGGLGCGILAYLKCDEGKKVHPN